MFFAKGRVILTISLAIFFSCSAFSQDFFEEFESLIDDEKTSLLPEKMIFTQKIFQKLVNSLWVIANLIII